MRFTLPPNEKDKEDGPLEKTIQNDSEVNLYELDKENIVVRDDISSTDADEKEINYKNNMKVNFAVILFLVNQLTF